MHAIILLGIASLTTAYSISLKPTRTFTHNLTYSLLVLITQTSSPFLSFNNISAIIQCTDYITDTSINPTATIECSPNAKCTQLVADGYFQIIVENIENESLTFPNVSIKIINYKFPLNKQSVFWAVKLLTNSNVFQEKHFYVPLGKIISDTHLKTLNISLPLPIEMPMKSVICDTQNIGLNSNSENDCPFYINSSFSNNWMCKVSDNNVSIKNAALESNHFYNFSISHINLSHDSSFELKVYDSEATHIYYSLSADGIESVILNNAAAYSYIIMLYVVIIINTLYYFE